MKILKYLILKPIRILKGLLGDLTGVILFKIKKVTYTKFPILHGKMLISNSGVITLGKDVTFRSSQSSNYVGLYKPCTIAVNKDAKLSIGDKCGFSGVSIYCAESITIGNYVNCGGNVCIWDTDFHPLNHLDRRIHDLKKIKNSPIIIEDDVFIGANSIILKGVRIGKRSIIGAGSVLTKSVLSDEIWGGNPAKFIKKI